MNNDSTPSNLLNADVPVYPDVSHLTTIERDAVLALHDTTLKAAEMVRQITTGENVSTIDVLSTNRSLTEATIAISQRNGSN